MFSCISVSLTGVSKHCDIIRQLPGLHASPSRSYKIVGLCPHPCGLMSVWAFVLGAFVLHPKLTNVLNIKFCLSHSTNFLMPISLLICMTWSLSNNSHSTRSLSVVTLARPPTRSTLKITDRSFRSFRYASPCLWNQLPDSFRQQRPHLSPPDSSFLVDHCQLTSFVITTLTIHHPFTLSFSPQNISFP